MAEQRTEKTTLDLSFKLKTSEVKGAIIWASKIINAKKHTLTLILENNRLTIEAKGDSMEGKFFVFATDISDSRADNSEKVIISVPTSSLVSLIGVVKDNEVKFIYHEEITKEYSGQGGAPKIQAHKVMTVKTSRQTLKLPVVHVNHPSFVSKVPDVIGTVNWQKLNDAFKFSASTIAHDDTFVNLLGLHVTFSPRNQEIHIASTDRHRLSRVIIPFESAPSRVDDEDFRVVISAEIIHLISQMKDAENVTLYVQKPEDPRNEPEGFERNNFVGISSSDYLGLILQKEVSLLNYQHLIDAPVSHRLIFNRKALLTSLQTAYAMGEGTLREAWIILKPDNEVEVKSLNSDEELEYLSGDLTEEIKFKVNTQYVTSLLNILKTERVAYCFSLPIKPVALLEVIGDNNDEINKNVYTMFSPMRDV